MNVAPLSSPALQTPVAPGPADRAATPAAAQATDTVPAAGAPKKTDPSRDEVDAAVKKLNDSMLGSSQTLQFSVDHDTKKIVVKLIDQDTKEVVRQMPSEEALRIAKSIDASMDKLQGRLIDHKA
jgi:flagellar protein FlaG